MEDKMIPKPLNMFLWDTIEVNEYYRCVVRGERISEKDIRRFSDEYETNFGDLDQPIMVYYNVEADTRGCWDYPEESASAEIMVINEFGEDITSAISQNILEWLEEKVIEIAFEDNGELRWETVRR